MLNEKNIEFNDFNGDGKYIAINFCDRYEKKEYFGKHVKIKII